MGHVGSSKCNCTLNMNMKLILEIWPYFSLKISSFCSLQTWNMKQDKDTEITEGSEMVDVIINGMEILVVLKDQLNARNETSIHQ